MSSGIGQGGKRVFGGEAGNVVGGLHGLLNGRLEKSEVLALPRRWPTVHRDAQRLVAVALHVLQLALAHRHAQAAALGRLGPGIGGAQLFGVRQGGVHQVFKKGAAVG
jgi:hypothetical protein